MGVDIETYSSVDLAKAGTRPYTEAPDFTILLIGYKVDDQPTRIIDLTGGAGEAITFLPVITSDLPVGDLDEFLCLLTDPEVTKTAYNAAFERTCLARYFDRPMPPTPAGGIFLAFCRKSLYNSTIQTGRHRRRTRILS